MAAGAIGVPALKSDDAEATAGRPARLEGPHARPGIVTPRTDYGFVAAYDVVDDDLPKLLRDLTGRIEELTQGWPDRLDTSSNDRAAAVGHRRAGLRQAQRRPADA